MVHEIMTRVSLETFRERTQRRSHHQTSRSAFSRASNTQRGSDQSSVSNEGANTSGDSSSGSSTDDGGGDDDDGDSAASLLLSYLLYAGYYNHSTRQHFPPQTPSKQTHLKTLTSRLKELLVRMTLILICGVCLAWFLDSRSTESLAALLSSFSALLTQV